MIVSVVRCKRIKKPPGDGGVVDGCGWQGHAPQSGACPSCGSTLLREVKDMSFSASLLTFSEDRALLEEIDSLWEKHRLPGDKFLHELPSNILLPMINAFTEMKQKGAEAATISRQELVEYRKLSINTTRRLNYALGLLQDLVDNKRGFSRVAIRGWIATLSAPLESGEFPKLNAGPATAAKPGTDAWIKQGREWLQEAVEHLNEHTLSKLPAHAAIVQLEGAVSNALSALNQVLCYAEELDEERREFKKQLQDFNEQCKHMDVKHVAEATAPSVAE